MQPWRYLIVPGRGNSEPGHWQSLWQARLGATRVRQRDWAHPQLPDWTAGIGEALDLSPLPTVLVAHSFGCLASAAAVHRRPERVMAALFVAPANPQRFPDSTHWPDTALCVPSVLISSQTDPWLKADQARSMAKQWGAKHIDGGAIGHVNRDSGHGEWPFGWAVLDQLIDAAQDRASALIRTATASAY